MKAIKRIFTAAACLVSMSASADLIDLNLNPSNQNGSQVVYEMDGTLWGLAGLSGGALDYTSPNSGLLDDLWSSVASGNVLGFHYADNMSNGDWAGSYAEGDMLTTDSYIETTYNGSDRFFDSIWVNFSGGNVVFNKVNGGTNTLGAQVTRDGNPFEIRDSQAVPAPATLLLFAAGLLSLIRFSRKK